MKKRMKRLAIILSSLAVFASFTGPQVSQAEGANGTAGVVLKKKDTGTSSSTDESSSTEESSTGSSSSSSGSGSSSDGGNHAGGGTTGGSYTSSGGKTYFPQTGEIVKGSMSVLGAAIVAFGFFLIWKNKKDKKQQRK